MSLKIMFSCLAAAVGMALPAAAQPRVWVNTSGFTAAQDQTLRKASVIVVQRIVKDAVIQCALQNANRLVDFEGNLATGQTYTQGASWVLVAVRDMWSSETDWTINITAKDLGAYVPNGTFTSGYANIGATNLSADGKIRQFYININRQLVNADGSDKLSDPETWSESISHEMIHNFGMNHQSTGNYQTDYVGSFVKEWGNCVESDGAGLSLFDPSALQMRD